MRRVAALLASGALAALTLPADGWQGHCHPDEGGARLARLDESLCELESTGDDPGESFCHGGLEYARGVQLGEHTWLTLQAMRQAGLPARFEQPIALRTWRLDDRPVEGSALTSVAPAALGGMRTRVTRMVAIPELSEIPDGSHSLSDWALGNEHCLVEDLPRATPEDLERCHSFKGHMGTLNATHWMPLSRVQYTRYHEAALETAAGCAAMRRGIAEHDARHVREDDLAQLPDRCLEEALALEAVAAHYLEDAWSAGHMFERWGSPLAADTGEGKLRAFFAAAITGFLHGTRAVLGVHDRANLPGPFDDDDEPFVRAVVPGQDGPIAVGGDLYLAECTAEEDDEAVMTATALEPQRRLMFTCLARGFQEVHAAAFDEPPALTELPGLDAAITSSGDEACWGARLTNASMLLALGTEIDWFLDVRGQWIGSPAVLARMVMSIVADDVAGTGAEVLGLDLPEDRLDAMEEELRRESARLAMAMAQQIHRGPRAGGGADGTGIATQQNNPAFDTFAGVPTSRTFRQGLEGFDVTYLERGAKAFWTDQPDPAFAAVRCATDDDCFAGTYCDRTTAVVSFELGEEVIEPRCVPHEGAILRAFREAETAHFCEADGGSRLSLARWPCQELGVGCDACAEVLRPHVRNGCGPDWWTEEEGGLENRSMCDVLGASTWPVYVPHAAGDPASFDRAVMAICRGEIGWPDPSLQVRAVADPREVAPGPGEALDAHGGVLVHRSHTCASAPGGEWVRFHHEPLSEVHVHTYAVRVTPEGLGNRPRLAGLTIEMRAGPDCAPGSTTGTQEAIDHDGDGAADTMLLTETVPANVAQDVCIQVRASDPELFWTEVAFAVDPFWLDNG